MNNAMRAIMKKDFRGVKNNRLLYSRLFMVPIIMVIFLPSVFLVMCYMTSNGADVDANTLEFINSLAPSLNRGRIDLTLANLLLNYIMPMFFLTIPIMSGATMAASAFVGEKERQTLETLLYCPLTLKQIFKAKVLASLYLSLLISAVSFGVLVVVFEIEAYFLLGQVMAFSAMWIVVLLLLVPAITMFATTLIVRESAKAQSVEESQQAASYLVLPVIAIIISQFGGLFLVNIWIILVIGILCAVLAWIFFNKAMKGFTYEKLID